MMEDILIYVALAAALIYLGRRFLFRKKSGGNGCGKDCNC